METKRAFLAVLLSLAILFGYQYFFVSPYLVTENGPEEEVSEQVGQPAQSREQPAAVESVAQAPAVPAEAQADKGPSVEAQPTRPARDIPIETSLFSAVVTENGGGIKSFKLKKYKESLEPGSDYKELIAGKGLRALPLLFSWGVDPQEHRPLLLNADQESIETGIGGKASLTMTGRTAFGLEIKRTLIFHDEKYEAELAVEVYNGSQQPLQGAPSLSLTNRPFSEGASKYLFTGPAVLKDGELQEIKVDDLKESSQSISGRIMWAAYEDTYFMCGILPKETANQTVHLSVVDEDTVTTVLSGKSEIIPPQGRKSYSYTIYFGPKELETLKKVGSGLDRIINFGWFDIIAKPTHYLLNFFYKYVHNYGVAIILVTILIKLLFWPLAQKGMKSMKTMQKIQPKMAKLREKYKNDRERLNQEMMKLYQTYKVNPVGGCLPMILQIPVFFALYKVLLQTIELRHAPFMLWINDLSAPDRLYIGFDLPMIGGLPVLTLLMGGSMFLQQKMTPTTGDPMQAKIMMFLPVVFTFMFINFASGLVLYWFVNNLLSMAQQYMINRQVE